MKNSDKYELKQLRMEYKRRKEEASQRQIKNCLRYRPYSKGFRFYHRKPPIISGVLEINHILVRFHPTLEQQLWVDGMNVQSRDWVLGND